MPKLNQRPEASRETFAKSRAAIGETLPAVEESNDVFLEPTDFTEPAEPGGDSFKEYEDY